jgi:uncharacterized protein DUF6265
MLVRTLGALIVLLPAIGGAQVKSLDWMSGCWEMHRGKIVVFEQWSAPRGGVMFGFGQSIRGDSTVDFEQTRIFSRKGKLVYASKPAGQEPAEFVLEKGTNTSVQFANPAHDFPQRIIYRRPRPDSLLARVEANQNGKARGYDFKYRRVTCPR